MTGFHAPPFKRVAAPVLVSAQSWCEPSIPSSVSSHLLPQRQRRRDDVVGAHAHTRIRRHAISSISLPTNRHTVGSLIAAHTEPNAFWTHSVAPTLRDFSFHISAAASSNRDGDGLSEPDTPPLGQENSATLSPHNGPVIALIWPILKPPPQRFQSGNDPPFGGEVLLDDSRTVRTSPIPDRRARRPR